MIIAEKPSVAKNIADAVGAKKRNDGYYSGEQYYITWAFGHLLELYDTKDYDSNMGSWKMEQFPFVPTEFLYKVKQNGKRPDDGAKKQLHTIKGLIDKAEVDGVISACDYDREGQIIGDIILDYLKVQKPVERLLLNEWTPDEVAEGMGKLIPNSEMSPLKAAGISRQWADWLIGINLTSVATLKYQRGYGKVLNVGRVLLPTLKIIYDRDVEIQNFVKEAYYKLKVDFLLESGAGYSGHLTVDGKDKFEDKEALQQIREAVKGKNGTVDDVSRQLKNEYAPPLFNLSGLQGHVTSKAKGWTSEKVLKVAQGLYEKKLITYPRTSSLALETSLAGKAEKVLNVHKKGLPFEAAIRFEVSPRVFDNAKVESHSAIMPTYLVPKTLTADERVVYEAVKMRFVAQFMPVAQHEEVTVTTGVEGHAFVSKGRIQKVEGWRLAEAIQSKDKVLPALATGDAVHVKKTLLEEKSTKPPKHHTEKTLLKVMETCGKQYKKRADDTDDDDEMIEQILSGFSIGTPATRAETIAKLKRIGYIVAKGKHLEATPLGAKMIAEFPVKALFDLEYTGRLEKVLADIGKGTLDGDAFMSEMIAFVKDAVVTIKDDAYKVIQDLEDKKAPRERLGKCPGCGADVVEGEKGYGCSNWKSGCKFVIWKDDAFLRSLKVTATRQTVEKLLEKGELYSSKFVSKKGKRFSAFLTYEKEADSPYYKWKMRF